ncbi:E3 ubiquitin-protein ligase RNF216 [Colletotrichum spaethianum]|uniref:E3 ubiquitin-protein ligase RNF216 n=1 Tax=Colletotrichum spaethianum TaxID=700344 RepID=A0AA37LF14_9PEZI|nr:E3 ubiquitin-protein ligase RNF216 [Colletotrichum spaethianum]GKT45375.1 E3 ubiquitin-protein ligase RNF216 [Colletotrichum spaethianum]
MAEFADETKSACAATVLSVFPEICPDFLEETAAKFQYNADQAIDDILSLTEKGQPYPKRSYFKNLKRKREGSEDPDEEANIRRTYDHPNRVKESNPQYIAMAKKVLKQEFPRATMSGILKVFASKSNQLLTAHIAIDIAVVNLQNGSHENIPDGFSLKKARTPMDPEYMENRLDSTIEITDNPNEKRALQELRAARKLQLKRINETMQAARELHNFDSAKANGTVVECGCCFDEFALNRMVSCEGPEIFHNAENAVGQSKYELVCMSMDQCKASFSHSQRRIFLTDQLVAALDRIENEAVLRMAGIENLERCPFCPYAAEYPPVETNREFRCDNPDCQKVSCRLCKEETHIPKTCEEVARDNGIGARHEIEEAMSAALIRKCNKCNTPFIKEMGCNKMTCTAANCRNIQCYVCSKSCDYSHFNDVNRGGKQGNCPLFDNVDARHNAEVQAAEEKARQKVLESNRLVDKDLLRFDMPGNKPSQPNNPVPDPRPAGRQRGRQMPPRLVQAPLVPAAQPRAASQPVVARNAFGHQIPQGNIGEFQGHPYYIPPGRQQDGAQIHPLLPQYYPVPMHVENLNGFPAWPPEDPNYAYGGFQPPPVMADVQHHFPVPQYQPQPQQPQPPAPGHSQRLQPMRDAVNWQGEPDPIWLANMNQPYLMGLGAPAGPGHGAGPEPAPAPRRLKRQKRRNKSARQPPKPLPIHQNDRQPEQMQTVRQAQQHGRNMEEQQAPRLEAQSLSAAALNPDKQDAQRARNPVAKEQTQQAQQQAQQEAEREAELEHLEQQERERILLALGVQPVHDQAQQAQLQPAGVELPGDHDLYTQWRRSMVVPKREEHRRAIQAEFAGGDVGAMGVREQGIRGMVPMEHAPLQINNVNPNLLVQPPAPDRPNWLMPPAQQERAPQEPLVRMTALRRRARQRAAAAGRTKDEPLELE